MLKSMLTTRTFSATVSCTYEWQPDYPCTPSRD